MLVANVMLSLCMTFSAAAADWKAAHLHLWWALVGRSQGCRSLHPVIPTKWSFVVRDRWFPLLGDELTSISRGPRYLLYAKAKFQ